jgi:hypothetical protein
MPAFPKRGSRRPSAGGSSQVTWDRDHDATSGDGDGWSPDEHALLDAALEFFGAAETVIDYAGQEHPRLRYDVGGLQRVRNAMASLEARIRVAADAGISAERIARITRLEAEIVDLILTRGRALAPGLGEG